MLLQRKARRRDGATSVEFAFVAILVFMLLFGIFEYGRFLFVYHITTNAARDAARFAVVRTNGGVSLIEVDGTQINELATITDAHVENVWRVGTYTGVTTDRAYGTGMYGLEDNISSRTFKVFAVPDSALYSTPPNLDPTGKPAWITADFHQQIAVQISGTYKPILPNLLGLNTDVPFNVTVLMGSEAN